MQLWVPTIKPSLQVVQSIENRLAQGFTQKLNYESMNMYRSPSFQETTPSYRITTSITKPTHVWVGLQATATEGSATANNQMFIPNGITEIELRVNNVQYPREKLTCDFSAGNEDVGRVFQNFLSYGNRFNDNQNGCLLNMIDFKTSPLFYFDLTNVEPSVFSVNGSSDLEVRCRMSNGTAVQFYVLVLSEREAIIHGNSTQLRLEQL